MLASGGIIIAIVLSEIILRLLGITYPNFFMPDPIVGIAHRPGVEGRYEMEGESYIKINSEGLRDLEHAKEKPPGTLRIAVLGDSFAEAFQVPRENTFWAIMARELQKRAGFTDVPVEVINFGTSAHGTAQELLTLRYRVWDYSPDVVFLAFATVNDIPDNSRALKQRDYIPYFVYEGDSLVLDRSFLESKAYRYRQRFPGKLYYGLINHSRIMQLINILRFHAGRRTATENGDEILLEPGLYKEVYLPPGDPVWKNAWRVTEGLLRRMKQEVKMGGARFFMVVLSNAVQVYPDPLRRERFRKKIGASDLFYPDRRIKRFAEENGISILTLAEDFQKHADKEGVYLHGFGSGSGRGHWNEIAHRLAGERIAHWLYPRLGDPGGRRSGNREDQEKTIAIGK